MTTMDASGRAAPSFASKPERSGGNPLHVAPWIVAAAAVLFGSAAGWAAVRFSGEVQFRLSALHVGVLALCAAATAAIVWRPVLGLVGLILLVYLHLSDNLIRFYELPSLLQLVAIPLALAVLVEWRGGVLRGLSPAAVTAALTGYVLVFVVSSTVAEQPALADARAAAAAKGFAVFVLALLLASTPERVRAGAWTLAAGGLLLGGMGLFQFATGDHGNDFGGLARMERAHVQGATLDWRIAGPVGDPNFFAQVLLIVVPVALILAWKERSLGLRILALLAAAVVAVATVFTYSRGGALALGAVALGSLVSARPSRRRLMLGAALLSTGLVLLPGDVIRRLSTLEQLVPTQEHELDLESSLEQRVLWARVAWRMYLDHPLLGVGAGNYTVHYDTYAAEVGAPAPEYDSAEGPHFPHNLYLELASETGLLGLFVFGTAVLLVLGHLRRAEAAYFAAGNALHAALASALALALVGFLISSLFLHGHYQRYLWVLLGLSAALAREAPAMGASCPSGRAS